MKIREHLEIAAPEKDTKQHPHLVGREQTLLDSCLTLIYDYEIREHLDNVAPRKT